MFNRYAGVGGVLGSLIVPLEQHRLNSGVPFFTILLTRSSFHIRALYFEQISVGGPKETYPVLHVIQMRRGKLFFKLADSDILLNM